MTPLHHYGVLEPYTVPSEQNDQLTQKQSGKDRYKMINKLLRRYVATTIKLSIQLNILILFIT